MSRGISTPRAVRACGGRERLLSWSPTATAMQATSSASRSTAKRGSEAGDGEEGGHAEDARRGDGERCQTARVGSLSASLLRTLVGGASSASGSASRSSSAARSETPPPARAAVARRSASSAHRASSAQGAAAASARPPAGDLVRPSRRPVASAASGVTTPKAASHQNRLERLGVWLEQEHRAEHAGGGREREGRSERRRRGEPRNIQRLGGLRRRRLRAGARACLDAAFQRIRRPHPKSQPSRL